jgi:2,4-diaminopentanoate dehydrogenase
MTGQSYRVAHFGTGDTGSQALRTIVARPEYELVAHLVHSPEKVGRDSGEIVGLAPVGVRATDSVDEFLAVDADCVTYFATDFGREPDTVIDEMCRMLESGRNVVTSTMPVLVYPPAAPPEVLQRLEAACAAGRASLFCSGIAPGFTGDTFVLTAASLCQRVTSVAVYERIFMGTYSDPLSFQYMGFGQPPEDLADDARPTLASDAFSSTFSMLADGLGCRFDEVWNHREYAVADTDHLLAAGPIPKGTVASVRLCSTGLLDGTTRVSTAITYSMIDHVVDNWAPAVAPGAPDLARFTQVVIQGEPHVDMTLTLSGSDQPGVDATAARVINSIAATCAASPGVRSPLDLPLSATRSFA